MIGNNILNDYFEWLCEIVKDEQPTRRASYKKLLMTLHTIRFRYFVDYDENRAADGEELRWRYVCDGGDKKILKWGEPCTVLEMLIGLAYQMEAIMERPDANYNMAHWFWEMVANLDLDGMTDRKFDKGFVYEAVTIFLDRRYDRHGNGNIFRIENFKDDLRDVEIWCQMCWYLDNML